MRTKETVDGSNLFQSYQGIPLPSIVGSVSALFPTATGVYLSLAPSYVQHNYQLTPFHSRQVVEPHGFRETEQAWMERNSDQLKTMVGEWVVIEKDELIVHSKSHRLAIEVARQRGIVRPFLILISREDVF